MVAQSRPHIPEGIRRAIFFEAGHCCAVCGFPIPLELAHIVPWRSSRNHSPENLLCLCPNCHTRADHEKWGTETLRLYKSKPWVIRWRAAAAASQPLETEIDAENTSASPFQFRPNPFGDLGEIVAPDRFFDRVEIIERLFRELSAGRNVSLVGEAQIGKSSLLTQICLQGPPRLGLPATDIVYLDMQMLRGDEDFFNALSAEIGLPRLPGYKFKHALGSRRIILCLDEFEKMGYQGFTPEVRSQLRGLAGANSSPFTLLLATRTPLEFLFPDSPAETSPLAPICPEIRLPHFSEEISLQFLRQRTAGTGVVFTQRDEEVLFAQSSGHPGRLQALAYERYEVYCNSGVSGKFR